MKQMPWMITLSWVALLAVGCAEMAQSGATGPADPGRAGAASTSTRAGAGDTGEADGRTARDTANEDAEGEPTLTSCVTDCNLDARYAYDACIADGGTEDDCGAASAEQAETCVDDCYEQFGA